MGIRVLMADSDMMGRSQKWDEATWWEIKSDGGLMIFTPDGKTIAEFTFGSWLMVDRYEATGEESPSEG